jgi:2,3-diketo-5-methylthio-1-phosphopentane phosphatase
MTHGPVLFFDFDNTITRGDMLDAVIARFSKDDSWREHEAAWQAGRMSTRECLARQIGSLKAMPEEILEFASSAALDPWFAPIVRKAAASSLELTVLSDSFTVLIDAALKRNDILQVRVVANELRFLGDRVEAHFPHLDPECSRCAHCKAQHFRALKGRETVFVGDGLSDVCAGMVADVVFAKDSLAAQLSRAGRSYLPFDSLKPVLDFLTGRGY